MTDSKILSRIFRDSDEWGCESVIQAKFEWLSGIVHKLELGTKPCVVNNFLNENSRK